MVKKAFALSFYCEQVKLRSLSHAVLQYVGTFDKEFYFNNVISRALAHVFFVHQNLSADGDLKYAYKICIIGFESTLRYIIGLSQKRPL